MVKFWQTASITNAIKAINKACTNAGLPIPPNVRAHDVRGVATSLRVQVGSSLDDVMQAGHWSNPSTFFQFLPNLNSLCHRQSSTQTKILRIRWKSNWLFPFTDVDADVEEDKTTEAGATLTSVEGDKKVADEDETSTKKKSVKKGKRKNRQTSSRGRDNLRSSKHSVTD